MKMPKVDLSVLEDDERELAEGIIATRGPNVGCLRASKPPVERIDLGPVEPGAFAHEWDIRGGKTAYIWRMVAFYVSPNPRHHAMPVTAMFDLPGNYDERRELVKELDAIVDKLVETVPARQWHGVARWSRALS